VNNINLSKKDLHMVIDLRPFVDPSPYVVSDLMPMRRVYRLFNQIGVRHLPVIANQRVVGILTRKDVLPSAMRYRASLLKLAGNTLQFGASQALSSVARSVTRRLTQQPLRRSARHGVENARRRVSDIDEESPAEACDLASKDLRSSPGIAPGGDLGRTHTGDKPRTRFWRRVSSSDSVSDDGKQVSQSHRVASSSTSSCCLPPGPSTWERSKKEEAASSHLSPGIDMWRQPHQAERSSSQSKSGAERMLDSLAA